MSKDRRERRKRKQLNEAREKTLYVRFPHTIRNKEEVEKLFTGDFKVKLLRQASRHCSVVFSSVEEKIKNLEAAKEKQVDGKNIIVTPFHESQEKDVKVVKKKIVMPEIKEDTRITQTLFITNIKCGTMPHEIKEALEGCVSVTFLKAHTPTLRSAVAKINDIKTAADYLTKTKEWPVVNGHRLILKPDTRVKHKKTKSKKSQKKQSQNDNKNKPDKPAVSETKENTEPAKSQISEVKDSSKVPELSIKKIRMKPSKDHNKKVLNRNIKVRSTKKLLKKVPK